MGNDVVFSVDVKHAPAVGKFLEFQRYIEGSGNAFEKAFKKAGDGGEAAASKIGEIAQQMGRTVAQFAGFGTALGAAYTTVRLIGAEYERMKQAQMTADDRKRGALPAFEQAKLNAGAGFNLESKANAKLTSQIMQARGSANAADTWDLIGHMMSGRGAVNQQETLNAALEVARYAGQRQLDNEGAKFLGGAVMDQANTDLAKGRAPNYRATLGKFEKGFGVSRSTSIQDFATHDMRAIVGLQRHYNVSESEAIGLQGAITEAMPDLHGRRGATENMLLFENMHQAFGELAAKKLIKSKTPEQFMAMSGRQRVEWASADTKEAKWMRAHLFGINTPDKDMRQGIGWGGYAPFGITEQGSLQGEAGGKEVARAIFTRGNAIVDQWGKNTSEVFTDPAQAAAYYDKVTSGKLGGASSKYSSDVAADQGLQALTDWTNTRRADAGSARKLADDQELKSGVGAMESGLRGIVRNLRLADPTEAGTDEEKRRIAADAQEQLLRRHYNAPRYMSGAGSLYKSAIERERKKALERMPDEEREAYDAYDRYIEKLDSQRRDGGRAPDEGDQSAVQTKLLEQIAASLDRGFQMNVQSEDVGGRTLGRQSSFAKPLEQLYDAPITG